MIKIFKKDIIKKISDILSNISDKMYKGYLIKEKELRELKIAFDNLDKEKDTPLFFSNKDNCYNEVGKDRFEKPHKDVITKKKFLKNNETRIVDYKVIKEYYISYINCINEQKNIHIRKECCKNLIAFILNIFLNYESNEILQMLCLFSYIHNGTDFRVLVERIIRIYNGDNLELPMNLNISIKKSLVQTKPIQKSKIIQSKYIGLVDEKTHKTLKDKFFEKRAITKMLEKNFSNKKISKLLPDVKKYLDKTYNERYEYPQHTIFDYYEMGLDKKTKNLLDSEAKTRGIKENLFTKENIKNAVENLLYSTDKRKDLILDDFIKNKTIELSTPNRIKPRWESNSCYIHSMLWGLFHKNKNNKLRAGVLTLLKENRYDERVKKFMIAFLKNKFDQNYSELLQNFRIFLQEKYGNNYTNWKTGQESLIEFVDYILHDLFDIINNSYTVSCLQDELNESKFELIWNSIYDEKISYASLGDSIYDYIQECKFNYFSLCKLMEIESSVIGNNKPNLEQGYKIIMINRIDSLGLKSSTSIGIKKDIGNYKLYSVICHIGGGINSGHYICFFYDDKNWYLMDDFDTEYPHPVIMDEDNWDILNTNCACLVYFFNKI